MVTVGPDRLAVSDFAVLVQDGRVAVDFTKAGNDLAGSLTIAALPLDLVRLAAPELEISGTVNGEASLDGTLAQPTATAALRVDDVVFVEAAEAGLTGIAARLEADWRGGRIAAEAAVSAEAGSDVVLTVSAPLVLDPELEGAACAELEACLAETTTAYFCPLAEAFTARNARFIAFLKAYSTQPVEDRHVRLFLERC